MSDDAEIITVPNRLLAKCSRGKGLDIKTIKAAAQEGIEQLKQGYETELGKEVFRLGEALPAEIEDEAAEAALLGIYNTCHEIRGQAATFNYELLTSISRGLCNALDHQAAKEKELDGTVKWAMKMTIADRVEVVKAHIDAMQVIMAEEVRGEGGEVGKELISALSVLTAKKSAKHSMKKK